MWKMTLKQEVIQETIDKEKQITEYNFWLD
jgi:hypothetical protein